MATVSQASLWTIDNFHWLRYSDLGRLVRRVSRGLTDLEGLQKGSYVAIAGYNDFEFAVADFAIAVAGMVSVGVHGTYTDRDAVAAISKVKCSALLFMRDMALLPQRQSASRWSVQSVKAACLSVRHFVVMDDITTGKSPLPGQKPEFKADASFLTWIEGCCKQDAVEAEVMDPFDSRGAKYQLLDCSSATSPTLKSASAPTPILPACDSREKDCHTVMFTSGSSGVPKAVAMGVDAFVYDIAGIPPEEMSGTSESITVSYIPLSHGSDRYKVWQHVVHGGRVGFVQVFLKI
jgi:long-subunit acyl-CoA synthetase (AMP-forming)